MNWIGRIAYDADFKLLGEVVYFNEFSMRMRVIWEDGRISRGLHLKQFHTMDSGYSFI